MAMWIKQSTSIDVAIGPFLDETDGKTAETGLTLTQPDIRLKKNGGAWAQKNAAQTLSHEEAGWYELTLDATDTNTLGQLVVAVHEAGALPVWREFLVVPANVYDSFVLGTDALDVSLIQWLGSSPNALSSGRIEALVGAMASGVLTAAAIAADAITAAKVASDVSAEIADAVWDEDVDSSHQTAGSAGKKLDDAGGAADPWATAIPGSYGAGTAGERMGRIPNVAAGGNGGLVLADAAGRAKADVERWQAGAPNALISGRIDANSQVVGDKTGYTLTVTPPTAGAIADAVWDEATAGHQTSGTTGRALTDAGGGGGGIAGPGALERTIGVTVGGNPLQGAAIWVATDPDGANVIAGPLITDSFGEVTVLLDAGTYYAWVRLDGYVAIVGQPISVS